MRTAIVTTYHGPTDTKGSRIIARARKGPGFALTVGYYSDAEPDYPHRRAAQALAERLGWHGLWVAGGIDNGPTVWVNLGRTSLDYAPHPEESFYLPYPEATK